MFKGMCPRFIKAMFLLLPLSIFGSVTGCGGPTACRQVEIDFNDRLEECGLEIAEFDEGHGTCTEKEANHARCVSDCINKAPCAAFSSTTEEAKAHNACEADCVVLLE